MTDKLRILIADDQRLFADGLRVVIESRAPQFEVVGLAENGREAVALVRERQPDIVLMDVRMPEMDGVEAARVVHEMCPNAKILMLTAFADDEYVGESLRHGAVGYLLKSRPAEELIDSIRALGRGILQIDQAVSASILQSEQKRQSDNAEFRLRLRALSPRERQVLGLLAQARRISAIATELRIAEQTARNHISNLYSKLGIHDRLEIVNYIGPIRDYLKETEGSCTSTYPPDEIPSP